MEIACGATLDNNNGGTIYDNASLGIDGGSCLNNYGALDGILWSGSILSIDNTSCLNNYGPLVADISNYGAVTFCVAGTQTYSGDISGTGDVTVTGGMLQLASGAALSDGTGSVTVSAQDWTSTATLSKSPPWRATSRSPTPLAAGRCKCYPLPRSATSRTSEPIWNSTDRWS